MDINKVTPDISRSLRDLHCGHSQTQELALTIRSDVEDVHPATTTVNPAKEAGRQEQSPLDLQSVDFLGPQEVVKQLFSLPYSQENPYFALHRMGNTLLIESIVGIDEQVENTHSVQLSQKSPSELTVFSQDRPKDTSSNDVSSLDVVSKMIDNRPISTQRGADEGSSTPQRNYADDDVASIHFGSAFLPTPGKFIPQCPPPLPFRQVMRWQLHDMRFAMGSDLMVYSTPDHPAMTVVQKDTTREIKLSTCLDHYLDNVMANVPELAMCMHTQGFIRGISVCRTDDIPYLESICQEEADKHSGRGNDKISGKGSKQEARHTGPALFDPKVIEFNAMTILRFMKENCSRENGTYIVRVGASASDDTDDQGGAIQVYDLQSISLSGKKKWKWLLAMLSYRFAIRLGHHYSLASPHSRVVLRNRQLALYSSCYDLLMEIRSLGGGRHATICAAVLEHIADIHLSRAESCTYTHRYSSRHPGGSNSESSPSHQSSEKTQAKKVVPQSRNTKSKKKKGKKKSTSSVNHISGSSSFDTLSPDLLGPTHPKDSEEEMNLGAVVPDARDQVPCDQSEYAYRELDDVDYTAEMNKSIEVLKLAMSNLLDVINGDSEDETPDEKTVPSNIVVGDVPCATIGVDVDEEQNEEDRSSPGFSSPPASVSLTLALQFSGLLHKAMLSCASMARDILSACSAHSGEASVVEATRLLHSIVPFCSSWIQLTTQIKNDFLYKVKVQEEGVSTEKNDTATPDKMADNSLFIPSLLSIDRGEDVYEESIEDMWNIDHTILSDVPLLWDSLGEVCRELSTGRHLSSDSAMSSHDERKGIWSVCEDKIRDMSLCFTSMTILASGFKPPADRVAGWCEREDAGARDDVDVSSVWKILCGGKLVSTESCSIVSQSMKSMYMEIATSVLNPVHVHPSHIPSSDLSSALEIQCFCFLIAALLAVRVECGWSKGQWGCEKRFFKPNKIVLSVSRGGASTRLNQFLRHLGDACNELGQQLYKRAVHQPLPSVDIGDIKDSGHAGGDEDYSILMTVYTDFQRKLLTISSTADVCYSTAVDLFSSLALSTHYEVGSDCVRMEGWNNDDVRNIITVRCNMSCLKRLLSTRLTEMLTEYLSSCRRSTLSASEALSTIQTPVIRRKSRSKKCSIVLPRDTSLCSPVEYLDQALDMCSLASSCLDDKPCSTHSPCSAHAMVAIETGCNYLSKGLLHRRCILESKAIHGPAASSPSRIDISTDERKRQSEIAIDCLERALSYFQGVKSPSGIRQLAATQYHLGSLHNLLWKNAVEIKTRVVDDAKELGGSDISSSVTRNMNYTSNQIDFHLEKTMHHYQEAHTYYLKYDVGPTLAVILSNMCDIYLKSFQSRENAILAEISSVNSNSARGTHDPNVAAGIIAVRSNVQSLLGGAFRVLVDCRFALTPAVLDRHGKHMHISGVVPKIMDLLRTLLLKLLTVMRSVCYVSPVDDGREDALVLLKNSYGDILKISHTNAAKDNNVSTTPNRDDHAKFVDDVNRLYDTLDRLNSCEWLRIHL